MISSLLLRVSSLTKSLVPMQSPSIEVRATGAAVTVVVSEDHARLLDPQLSPWLCTAAVACRGRSPCIVKE